MDEKIKLILAVQQKNIRIGARFRLQIENKE